ncbi:hypothetical protein Tco_0046883 [Tanacetum coccineum]
MESVKKSIDERAKHKQEYNSWVNKRQMQTTEDKVDSSKALDASLVDTESSGIALKEQDTSSRLENDAHANDADIKPIYDEEPMAEVQTTAKINIFATRQQRIEPPEFNNEGEVDQNAKQCHDTCLLPAKLTDNQTTELSNQSLESENIRPSTRTEKGFAIAALKNKLRKLTGNSVNTKFAKSSILRKPALQPRRNQSVVRQSTVFKSERPRFSKQRFASQVDVNNDLSKPDTTYYLPKEKESVVAKPHHMIAPGSSRYSVGKIDCNRLNTGSITVKSGRIVSSVSIELILAIRYQDLQVVSEPFEAPDKRRITRSQTKHTPTEFYTKCSQPANDECSQQLFEAFKISNSEGLEKGYDRFQQLLLNLKLMVLKVFEQEIQGASKTSSSAQNVAFVSQSKSSTNKVKSGFTGAYSTCTPSTSSTNVSKKDVLAGFADEGPQKPEISVSDDNSSEHSTCQSNDSEGSCGNTSEHSFETESESLSEPNEMSKSRLEVTNEKDVSAPKSKEVEPSCVSHIKTPRQPLKDKETHKVNRKNWNDMMERELGEGYSFTKKKCFVCGSLNHLIKDCDYYEKKMAREAEVKRVVNTGNRVAKPVWTNANRVNHANQFVPRSVQLNAGRPKLNSVRPNINTGRTNINSVRPKVNAVSPKVNTVRSKQPVTHKTSNSMSPKRPQMNQINQRRDFSKSHSSVRRPFAKSTAQMANSNAVMGSWGSAVKTSASYNWRNSRPNFNYNSGPTFIRTVNANGPQGRPKPAKAWAKLHIRYALTSNPTIYDSLVKQFWQTATANTKADGSLEINATIDTIGYTITEASIRDSLQLEDATGITMLPNDELFKGIGQMGYPTDGTFTFWKSFFIPQ